MHRPGTLASEALPESEFLVAKPLRPVRTFPYAAQALRHGAARGVAGTNIWGWDSAAPNRRAAKTIRR